MSESRTPQLDHGQPEQPSGRRESRKEQRFGPKPEPAQPTAKKPRPELTLEEKARLRERRWRIKFGSIIAGVIVVWVGLGLLVTSDDLKMNGGPNGGNLFGTLFPNDHVSKGMSKSDVTRILGRPDSVSSRFSGGIAQESWTYSSSSGRSCVTFTDGKVSDYLPIR